MSHALITFIEAHGLLAVFVPMAAVVGPLVVVALVTRSPRGWALAADPGDG
jgi:hypothetical protein